jgi:FkbM family methyltransferase
MGLISAIPKLSLRAHLVRLKATGRLGYMSWSDLLETIIPARWKIRPIKSLQPAIDATAKSHAEGAYPVLWDTALGPFWGRDSDGHVLYWTVQAIVFERGREHPHATIQANDVVFDVGSHVGAFTRYCLRRGARLVVAIEPEPINAECFRKNFQNELREGRVILVDAAVSDNGGTLQLSMGDDARSWSFSALPVLQAAGASKVTVRTTTIDAIVEELNLSRVDFIKMNIEGSERPAIQGARRTIARFTPRMEISVHHLKDDLEKVPALVHGIQPKYATSFNATFTEAFFH